MSLLSFKNHIKSYNILSDEEIEEFASHATIKHLQKSDFFIKEGEKCKNIAFVMSGMLRSYYRLQM